MRKPIAIDDLEVGMMVSAVLEQNGPVKIRKVGMIKSPEMKKGLREMGVSLLEIDFAQSISVDETSEHLPEHSAIHTGTPSQLLMQNTRAIGDADRKLSQHFHRSMFMPSADSLPSRWHLYGKNITIAVATLMLGLVLGWYLAKLPSLLETPRSDLLSELNEPASSKVGEVNQDSLQLAQERQADDIKTGSEQQNIQDESSSTQSTKALVNTNISADDQAQEATSNVGSENLSTDSSALEDTREDEVLADVAAVESQTSNDIVLGYQPENVEELLKQDTSSSQALDANSNISPELLAKFNAAIAELDAGPTQQSDSVENASFDDVPRVDQLSVGVLSQLPSMTFSAHMYASTPENRWVRVNSLRMVEGDYIADDLQLVNIEAQRVILSFKGEVFSMNALSDW